MPRDVSSGGPFAMIRESTRRPAIRRYLYVALAMTICRRRHAVACRPADRFRSHPLVFRTLQRGVIMPPNEVCDGAEATPAVQPGVQD